MVAVRKNEFIKFEDGVSVERMELDVDTAAELPEVDFLSGHKLYMGSIAWVISTGEFYAIQSDGTWVNQSEAAETAMSAVATMSAPIKMLSAVKPESEVSDIEPLSENESIEDGIFE